MTPPRRHASPGDDRPAADPSPGEPEPSPYGVPGEPPLPRPWRPPPGGEGDLRAKGWVPPGRFALWWLLLLLGDLVFYVLLTPIWLGLRAAAWVAEIKSRVRRPS